MGTGTLVFKNGSQLTLPAEIAGTIASQLDSYWSSPTGDKRVYKGRYSSGGGSNNEAITVDLESLMYVLHK